MQERRDQFHTLRLGESLDPFNPAVTSFLEQARGVFLQQSGDPVAAQQLAWQALENLRQQQASALAYFDVFLMLAVVTLVLFAFAGALGSSLERLQERSNDRVSSRHSTKQTA